MESEFDQAVAEWQESKDYLSLARYLKDTKGKAIAMLEFRKITGTSIQNVHDLVLWSYYGGHLSDEEFRLHIKDNWSRSHFERNAWIYDSDK